MTSNLFPESLFTEIETLRVQNESQRLNLIDKDKKILFFESELERLNEMLVKFKKLSFGPKSERWESDEQGKFLFNEAEVEAKKEPVEEEEEEETINVPAHTKQRGKRKPLPDHLPREIVVVELPESERVDVSGNPLIVIGKEISEKLTYEPAKLTVTEYHRLRYGLGSGDPVKTAPPVPSMIPKGIATPGLLAGIVTAKYADGLPLYRQEEIFARIDVELSRTSMARWIIVCAELAQPIWNILEERLMERPYVGCDESHVQVLKEKGRKAATKSWMWVRSNPSEKEKIILFDYDPHRSGEVAKRLLQDFKGYLQVDG